MINTNSIMIRLEKKEEYREVEKMVRESFWNVYHPGCFEHYVLNQLRDDPAFVPELDFVMEQDGQLIGQNMFMRANIKADDGRTISIMTMGPICITPEPKRKGYGKILLDYSLEKAKELGCGAVCFEGNIDFYGRSGFAPASTFGIRYHGLPEGEDASFFLCKELIPGYLDGITGEYATPQGYFVDESEVETFDKEFPHFLFYRRLRNATSRIIKQLRHTQKLKASIFIFSMGSLNYFTFLCCFVTKSETAFLISYPCPAIKCPPLSKETNVQSGNLDTALSVSL